MNDILLFVIDCNCKFSNTASNVLNHPVKVGMFKIHPKVPDCMSDVAKDFIMNCFTPNPDNRATAAELLGDTFLRSSPRKKTKALQEPEPKDCLVAGEASVHVKFSLFLSYMLSLHLKKKNFCFCYTCCDTCSWCCYETCWKL